MDLGSLPDRMNFEILFCKMFSPPEPKILPSKENTSMIGVSSPQGEPPKTPPPPLEMSMVVASTFEQTSNVAPSHILLKC